MSIFSKFHLLKSYFKYLSKGLNAHDIHSPYVYFFYTNVLHGKNLISNSHIEKVRQVFLKSSQTIEITDLGAGSLNSNHKIRPIKTIAKHALKPVKYASLIGRFIQQSDFENIVELGTSLGITTQYIINNAAENTKIISIEGDPAVYKIAKEYISHTFPKRKVLLLNASFDTSLPEILNTISGPTLYYIDGNHTYDATMRYFNLLLPKLTNSCVILFDDIYWSKAMTQSWVEIKNNPSVKLSIDVFALGFVFFRDEFKFKQDFILKF